MEYILYSSKTKSEGDHVSNLLNNGLGGSPTENTVAQDLLTYVKHKTKSSQPNPLVTSLVRT